jgi:hypothetical protein
MLLSEIGIMPCSPLNITQEFGGTWRLHLQGRQICFLSACWFCAWLILRPWKRRYDLLKRRLTLNVMNGVIP